MNTFFTDKRREYIARLIANLILIMVASAFASKFFIELSHNLRILLGCGIIVAIFLGIWICPKNKERGE